MTDIDLPPDEDLGFADGHGLGHAPETAIAVAPHNLEIEQALLGVLLYDNAAYERLTDSLQGRHFYEPFHARLFQSIETHIRKGQLAEPILLADEFSGDAAFNELGGLRYLADLVDRAPPSAGVPNYGRAIVDLSIRRDLIRIGGDIVALAHDGVGKDDVKLPARDQIEVAEQALFGLAENRGESGGLAGFGEALDEFMSTAEEAMNRDGSVTGVSTGLIDLDAKSGGLHPSDLIVLAGRPSMGKTSLATNMAYHAAKNYTFEVLPDGTRRTLTGGIVAFYSLEMSKAQLAGRIVSDVAGVSGDQIRKGTIDRMEFMRMREVRQELEQIPLYIDDTGGLNIAKLTARARRLKRRIGLDLVVVDYLQLATGTEKTRGQGRVQEVSEITMALKSLAKELSCPVVALSQLSRQVENREDKRPQLADLRESGSIEQDADMVWFVYREAYYVGRAEPKENTPEHLQWQEEMGRLRNLADVIIAKQRHGPIGTVKLTFNEDTTRFGSLARESFYMDRGRQPYGGDE